MLNMSEYNALYLATHPELAAKIGAEYKRNVRKEFNRTHGKMVVMAIKPKYARMIYDGKKFWELRKAPPPLMTEILIYESAPVSAITGSLVFSSKIEGWADDVIEMVKKNKAFTSNLCGIGIDELIAYAGEGKKLAALRVFDPRRLDKPIPLKVKPPQNWGTFYYKKDEEKGGRA